MVFCTCPLLLDGPNVGISEFPVMCQLLPLARSEVLGSQSPRYRADVLCFQPVILLKGQVLCHPGVRVTVQIVLQSQNRSFGWDATDVPVIPQPPSFSSWRKGANAIPIPSAGLWEQLPKNLWKPLFPSAQRGGF